MQPPYPAKAFLYLSASELVQLSLRICLSMLIFLLEVFGLVFSVGPAVEVVSIFFISDDYFSPLSGSFCFYPVLVKRVMTTLSSQKADTSGFGEKPIRMIAHTNLLACSHLFFPLISSLMSLGIYSPSSWCDFVRTTPELVLIILRILPREKTGYRVGAKASRLYVVPWLAS